MTAEEKILKTLLRIKGKADIAPEDAVLDYRAGWEVNGLGSEEEILILNKLASQGIIDVIDNFTSDYV